MRAGGKTKTEVCGETKAVILRENEKLVQEGEEKTRAGWP